MAEKGRSTKKNLNSCSIIIIFLIGCAGLSPATKPNISALYRIPTLKPQLQPLPEKFKPPTQEPLPVAAQTLFQQLYALDAALTLEVGKLPEFQGKVDQREILALTRFIDVISNASQGEKSNLTYFLEVGKPAIRRYCAPLQAIFWLLEEDEIYLKPNPLQYPLREILLFAWDFKKKGSSLFLTFLGDFGICVSLARPLRIEYPGAYYHIALL